MCIVFMKVMLYSMVFLCGVMVFGMREIVFIVFCKVLSVVRFVNMCIVVYCFFVFMSFYLGRLLDIGIFFGS